MPTSTFSANITLITGDTVSYREAGGRTSATLVPSPASNSGGVYRSYQRNGDLYVVPMDADPYVASGAVDQELFDVTLLAHGGYGDTGTSVLPLVVSYDASTAPSAIATKAHALPSVTLRHTLESVHAAGVSVGKSAARTFWQSITGRPAGTRPASPNGHKPALVGGVAKLWLDRKVKASLNESVPFIGAPQAWQAGVDGTGVKVAILDTGIDDTHPDFAGKIAEERNFTADPSAADGFGHGTHVASIITGSGAASGGKYKGVAPGVQLLIGKVLDHTGSGFDSDIIAGMQWATAQGARVVSMSLGSNAPSDGTDELSQAVDALTASTGALFVIAAGNAGPDARTVASPGAASSALTVGAVTKTGVLANFSSRGPLVISDAVKPEITAPGVSIVAARAAGTSLGGVVDQFYTTLSGTSMATPHVAGSAAILAQEHPTWTAPLLKAALIGSAKDYGYSVFEQGAGRVDVAREIHQDVVAEPSVISAGGPEGAPGDSPIVKDVTFRNLGGTDRTYQLALTGDGADTAGKLSQSTVTVPAGGTATIQLTIDAGAVPLGPHSWRIEATNSDGDQVVVPVGFVREPPRHKVTIRIINLHGDVAPTVGAALRVDNATQDFVTSFVATPTADPTVQQADLTVPEGVHDFSVSPFIRAAPNGRDQAGFLELPEVPVRADTVVTFDMNKTVPIRVNTPVATEEAAVSLETTRTVQTGQTFASFMGSSSPAAIDWLALPTTAVTIGAFKFSHGHTLTAPQVTLRLDGNGATDLRPLYASNQTFPWLPKFTTDQVLSLATGADLNGGRNVRGKLVFVDVSSFQDLLTALDRAAKAGAVGALTDTASFPDNLTLEQFATKIPTLWLDQDQANAVRNQLAGSHLVTAKVHAQLTSPFEYKLRYYELNQVTDQQAFTVQQQDLATVDTSYHSESVNPGFDNAIEDDAAFRPEDFFSFTSGHSFNGPTQRIEYYQPTGPDVMWWRTYVFFTADMARISESRRRFLNVTNETESWNDAVLLVGQARPGPALDTFPAFNLLCAFCKQSDKIYITPSVTGDADPSHDVGDPGSLTVQVFKDGQEIAPQIDASGVPFIPAAGTANYQLRLMVQDDYDGQKLAKTSTTTWSFRSDTTGQVAPPNNCIGTFFGDKNPCGWLPFIYPQYHLPLALDDTTAAGREFDFTIDAMTADPAGVPAIAGARVWVSYDDGKHWTQASVSGSNGTFTVRVVHPALKNTTGAVSIKTEIWDTAGNKVDQQIDRAYGLTAPSN